jgi:uncharacterized protein with HEPN domain
MTENDLKYLIDIQNYISEINSFFVSCPKTFQHYKQNILLKRAIERNFEIIGEAMNRLLKENPIINISDSKRIVGLRNRIKHSYDAISDENFWGVVINYMPKLESEISKLINQTNQ